MIASQRIIRASSDRVDRVWRVRARLAVARGHPFSQTAKLLTLFRPATGDVRATGVTSTPGTPWVTVLHPWLQEELSSLRATLPAVTIPEEERPEAACWETWLGHERRSPLPPLRVVLSKGIGRGERGKIYQRYRAG